MSHIPIIDVSGKEVARVEWTGELVTGSAEIKSKSKSARKKIETAIESFDDLKEMQFHSNGPEIFVMGWQGFEGWSECLRLSLPSVGLRIDDEKVVWPESEEEYTSNLFNEEPKEKTVKIS